MDKETIKLDIKGIQELERRRNSLNNDIELSIIRIKTVDKEITQLTKALNDELINKLYNVEG